MKKATWGDRIEKDVERLQGKTLYDATDLIELPDESALTGGLPSIGRALLANLIPDLAGVASRTQSPIEEAMLAGLLIAGLYRCDQVRVGGDRAPVRFGRDSEMVPEILTITPQATIGRYRADFMLTLRCRWGFDDQYTDGSILVECDGHDYHERSKEQAKRDKKRDRALQAAGFEVHHFTGSEIWDEPVTHAIAAIQRVSEVAWEANR